jgi:hypothetical protein
MFCHPDALAAGLARSVRNAPPGPQRTRLAAEHSRRAAAAAEVAAAFERRQERNALKRAFAAWERVAESGRRPGGEMLKKVRLEYEKRKEEEKKSGGSGEEAQRWKQDLLERMSVAIAKGNQAMLAKHGPDGLSRWADA